MLNIDWSDPKAKVSKYFTVHECLYLPTWKRLATEEDGLDDVIRENLIDLCSRMDVIRDHFNSSITVHVTYRPEKYNKEIGGASNSAHRYGKAIDFDVSDYTCDDVRKQIILNGLLDSNELRCEDAPGTNWVHLDTAQVGASGKRFFKP